MLMGEREAERLYEKQAAEEEAFDRWCEEHDRTPDADAYDDWREWCEEAAVDAAGDYYEDRWL